MLLAPTQAPAVRLDTDEIAGVPLAAAGIKDQAPDLDAASGLVVAGDGRTLWARSPHAPRSIASITKLMTALVTLERTELDEMVTVSEAASRVPYATGLVAGERRSVKELLELALVVSSNDAAQALAEHIGGSAAGFASLMNRRASELGLTATRFVNPHGLDADGHYSCATDIAKLHDLSMQDPEIRRIVAMSAVTLPAYGARPVRTIESTDDLLDSYAGLQGGKTGFTNDAKYCFVATAMRDGVELTALVLGAKTSSSRFDETSRLLDWGFEHLRFTTIATTTETVGVVPLAVDPAKTVALRHLETTSTLVFDLDGPIERVLSAEQEIDLPVYEGQQLGEMTLSQGERVLAILPVVAAADIASAEETVGEVPVLDYLDRTVTARASGEAIDVPEFDDGADVERVVLLDRGVSAPVARGDRIGTVTYAQNGNVFLEVPVVAAESVEAPGALERVGIWFARAWRWVTASVS